MRLVFYGWDIILEEKKVVRIVFYGLDKYVKFGVKFVLVGSGEVK